MRLTAGLSQPIDVYTDWIDKCDEVNNQANPGYARMASQQSEPDADAQGDVDEDDILDSDDH